MAETVPVPDIEQAGGLQSPSTQHDKEQATPGIETEAQLQDIKKVEAQKVVVLSFRSLQLRRIAELQDELLALAIRTADTSSLPATHNSDIDKKLRDYADALRNYETLSLNGLSSIPTGSTLVGVMAKAGDEPPPPGIFARIFSSSKNATYGKNKTFQIHIKAFAGTLDKIRAIVNVLPNSSPGMASSAWAAISFLYDGSGFGPSNMVKTMELTMGNVGFRELDQQGRLSREQKQAFSGRVAMALFGGISLIVPMLIMTLNPSQNKSLITTSVATFIFAITLALGATDSAGKDVLAATAAYTAVLVVFVGTSA